MAGLPPRPCIWPVKTVIKTINSLISSIFIVIKVISQSTCTVDLGPEAYSNSQANCHLRRAVSPPSIQHSDIDTRWPYRVGYPKLCSLPVATHYLKTEEENRLLPSAMREELGSQICQILKRRNIPHRFGRYAKIVLRTCCHQETRQPEHLRIEVDCIYSDEHNSSTVWVDALMEIYSAYLQLAEPDNANIGIELADFTYEASIKFCDIPRQHNQFLLENWRGQGLDYRGRVLAKLGKNIGKLNAMMPVGYRAYRAHGPPDHIAVLFIDASNAEDEGWVNIKTELCSVLPDFMGVEIWQATDPFFKNDVKFLSEPLDKMLSPEDFQRPPKPGTSVGRRGHTGKEFGGGTLGGYVQLRFRDSEELKTFGITNAHVVLDSSDKVKFHLGTSPPPGDLAVQSPYEADREGYERCLQLRRESFEEAIEAIEPLAAFDDKKLKALRRNQGNLTKMEEALELARKDPTFGSIVAAVLGDTRQSINNVEYDMATDVALVEVDTQLPPDASQIQMPQNTKEPEIMLDTVCDMWQVQGLSQEDKGEYIRVVAKRGRTTGYTMGLVHEIQCDIKLPLAGVEPDGRPIVSAWCVRNLCQHQAFSQPGDSGSLIIAAKGWTLEDKVNTSRIVDDPFCPFVVGLLFASSGNGELTYFVPWDVVKEMIEDLTGAEMVWPTDRLQ